MLKDSRTDLAVLRLKDTKEKFATLDFANSDELLVGDVVLAIGNPVRRRPDRDARHHLGAGAHAGRHHRLSVLHPDRCGDQSRQFRRRAGRHDRQARRHQHRDLLALRRLAGHRLCDSRQHGARRRGLRQERRQGGEAAVSRREAAGGDARYRRDAGAEAAERGAGRQCRAEQSGGARRAETVRPDRGDRRADRSTIPTPSTIASPRVRSAARRRSTCSAPARP